jgi:hypothetical protein
MGSVAPTHPQQGWGSEPLSTPSRAPISDGGAALVLPQPPVHVTRWGHTPYDEAVKQGSAATLAVMLPYVLS